MFSMILITACPLNAQMFLHWGWWNLGSPNANWVLRKGKKPNHKFFYCSPLCEIPAAYLFAHNTNTSLEPVLVSSKYTN